MNEVKSPTQYSLSVGAIALLQEILPTPGWYKDDAKQAQLIGRSHSAAEALPDLPPRPVQEKEESKESFEKRVDDWAAPMMNVEWTDKQKGATCTCFKFYLKQGAFRVNEHVISLLALYGLEDE